MNKRPQPDDWDYTGWWPEKAEWKLWLTAVENLRYPLKTIVGLSLAAWLSLYGILLLYGEQSERTRTAPDPYQLQAQQERLNP